MKQIQVNLSHKEIKELIKEYTTITDDDDDFMLSIKTTLQELDKADLIVFCLYTHLSSERKTADILGVSRTPIHCTLTKIREIINENLESLK